jgi:methionine-rich copper-binding protein CopC
MGGAAARKASTAVNKLRKHLSFSNVIACLALFMALSASAYAAKATLTKNQVKAKNIAKEAVTAPKLKNGGVISSKLATNSVINSKIVNGAVTSGKLANGSVRSSQLGGSVVTEAKLKNAAVSNSKLGEGAVSSSKLASTLAAQLVKNVTYVNAESATNSEVAKSAEAVCPSGKQAIGGGVRVNGSLQDVAVTGSNPTSVGSTRTGWSAFARDVDNVPGGNWSVEAFAVCAEL